MLHGRRTAMTAPSRRNFKINAFGGYVTGVAENLVDLSESKYCYNFVARDGELTHGTGTAEGEIVFSNGEKYLLPQPADKAQKIFFYKRFDKSAKSRDDRLIVYTTTNEIYSLSLSKKSDQYVKVLDGVNALYNAVQYRLLDTDILLIITDGGLYVYDGEKTEKVEGTPDIRDLCIHSERAFACVGGEGVSLWFSGSMNPLDWTVSSDAGGYVTFANYGGALKKVLSFGGYLYVFREYGIERVSAYGDQSEFSVKTVYSSTDRIYEDTVAVCGNRIVFLSEKGLHVFDGATVSAMSKVVDCEEYAGRGNKARATYYKGVYYLALYMTSMCREEGGDRQRFIDNNSILCYDTVTGRVDIVSDHDVASFCVVTLEDVSGLFLCVHPTLQRSANKIACVTQKECMRLGYPATMYWRTGMTDLGYPEKEKFLKSITVTMEEYGTVGVILDDTRVEFDWVKGVQKKLNVNKKFKKIGLYFQTHGITQRIGNPVLTVDMR